MPNSARALQSLVRRLAAERSSPREVGLSVLLGIVVGTTPFWGGHTLMAIALATVLKLNRVLAVLASTYSIPPLVPLVAFASIQIGRLVTTGGTLPVSYEAFTREPLSLGVDWLIGSLFLGLALGAPLGLGAAAAVKRIRRRESEGPIE